MRAGLCAKLALLSLIGVAASAVVMLVLTRNDVGPGNEEGNGLIKNTRRKEHPGFREAAAKSGITFRMNFLPDEQGENFKINLYDHGCGVAIADFDKDGHEDLYFVNQLGTNALYRNRGDGTFVDVTEKAGVGVGDRICVGAAFGDYDNDGYPDLFVTSTRGGNILFHNNGDGTFTNVTKEAGLVQAKPLHAQTAVFFDYNNDGYLDLFVTNSAEWTLHDKDAASPYYPGVASLAKVRTLPKEYNILYRNNGDGTFTNVTAEAGLKGQGWGGDVAVFDYDQDGRLDLLVTNMFGNSQLFRNNGDGTFSDVTVSTLGTTSFGPIGAKAFDFNNDGKLDLLLVDMHSDMLVRWVYDARTDLEWVKRQEGQKHSYPQGVWADEEVIFGNTLFKNLGQGKFTEVSAKAGIETFWPWGIATGDFDNDGYEDVFLPSGMGYPFFYWPNRLMMNNGDETFTERSEEEGIEPPPGGIYLEKKIGNKDAARSSRCAATADFSRSGRLDIITNNFNDHPYYFKNEFQQKNYIAFRLEGAMRQGDRPQKGKQKTKSNRDAVGALVFIYMGKEVMVRQVNPAGGYLSQSSRTLHFGLGDRQAVERVEIRWPSGIRRTIKNPEINRLHPVAEQAGS